MINWTKIQSGMRYVRGVSKGVRKGDLFPAAGRLPVGTAPAGSEDPPLRLGPIARLRQEGGVFTAPVHSLEVAGLARPLEILHLTDVHLRGDDAWVARLAEAMRPLRPDLVVLTGDVVAREWTREAVDHFLSALPPAPLGRWAAIGNWEYWAKAPPPVWGPILAAHDVGFLFDAWTDLGPLVLAGTDDFTAGQPDLRRTVGALPPDRPAVVLSHSPGLFPQLARPEVALVLSGHSHAGQVRLPALGAFWVPRGTGPYVGGWYQQDQSHLYVSRGVGWSIAPVRLWCPPELARIRLLPAAARA